MIARTTQWRVIKDGCDSAAHNMAVDEVLFRRLQRGLQKDSVLRVYGFMERAITVGRCQRVKCDQELLPFLTRGSQATRRITGGGAVYHGGDVTYSIITAEEKHPCFRSLEESYEMIHRIIKKALLPFGNTFHLHHADERVFMGTEKCFALPVKNDVMLDQIKIAGGAQKRTQGFILHQGSILLEPLLSHADEFDNLFDYVSNSLITSFCTFFGCAGKEQPLNQIELEEALVLEEGKYRKEEWILLR